MAIRLRPMTNADVALGMHLKTQAGWNQLEADWRRFLAMEPEGCFVAELEGQPVGTVCTCIFDSVAWVAMVLVEAELRGHGIGTALMKHALAWLDGQGVRTVRLDATPLGRPVYEKLGFMAEYELHRYEGTLPTQTAEPLVELARPNELDEIAQLDCTITGTARRKFLTHLYAEWPEAMRLTRQDGRLTGYLSARRGARAVLLGPCLADAMAGPALFADAWQRYAGQPIFLDIPVDNGPAIALAKAQGLRVQRSLLRMGRGPVVTERREQIWSSSGPEKG